MPLKKRTDLVQQKSGRALCHRVAGSSIALRFAPLAVAEDSLDEDSTLFPLVAVEDANGNHQRFVYHLLTGLPQYVIDGNGRVFSLNFGNVADEQSPLLELLF